MITVDSINTRLFRNISLNTLQVLANQFLGLFIFLLLSRYLDKDIYGELNWSMAILTVVTTILSLRLEQVVVRNVAAGKDPSSLLTLFTMHNVATGTIFFGLLLAGRFLFPVFFHRHYILWILSVSQLLTFFSLPFRQLAIGKSAFGWLMLISTVSNLIRCAWLGWLVSFSAVNLYQVLIVFTVSALVEFLMGAYIVTARLRIPFRFPPGSSDYIILLKESLPQIGLVFLTAGIARIDWILMGLLSTPARTAEYSFAYRAFEFAPLPLLITAPFLLNSFSRRYNSLPKSKGPVTQGQSAALAAATPPWLDIFMRLQIIFATLLPLWGILLWSPLIDFLTHQKYGRVNLVPFLILSGCIPFQYLINLFWSAEFARNRLGPIFLITAITSAIVVAGDFLLIPSLAGKGAALAYLVAMIVQYFLYSAISGLEGRKKWGLKMLVAVAISGASGGIAVFLTESLFLQLLIATIVYGLLTWGSGWPAQKDFQALKQWK